MAKADSKGTKLNVRKIKARMKLLKMFIYKNCPVYIRLFHTDIFTWDFVYENQIWSGYISITPGKGKTKLSDEEIEQAANIVVAGAITTIDNELGVKLDKKSKEVAEKVLNS